MANQIPDGITREHILQAIDELDSGIYHKFADSTGYDILHEGRRYPPKPIIGIAASYILGKQLGPSDFVGGLQSKCFKILEVNQFEIITKGDTNPFPESIENTGSYTEGAATQVIVNRYERDKKARAQCVKEYGAVCQVCRINFEKVYGAIGEGFIHVHHLKQLSDIGKEYVVDPITDLVPVCPNCHAMLHKRAPPFSIAELKAILNANKPS